jgi:hypothetical protein
MMDSAAALGFKLFLRELNRSLRSFGFKRTGQSFARQFPEIWQVINVQVSVSSTSQEKVFTVNFGIDSKIAMQFRGANVEKAPLHYACPISFRIGWFADENDLWWRLKDDASARQALDEILQMLISKGIPFLNTLQADSALLEFYGTGLALGFEINRDETRLLLLAGAGVQDMVQQRLGDYQVSWISSAAKARASAFLAKFKIVHNLKAPLT